MLTFRDAVAQCFTARPNTWIDLLELMDVGGVYAARTRVSECRTQLHMAIENKVVTLPNGSKRSLYRYTPPADDFQLTA